MSYREIVRAGYDALGPIYAENRTVNQTERDLLEWALAPCPPRPRLLDVGCGPGPTLAELADPGRAVGLDISAEQLVIAAQSVPTTTLVRGDIAALPFDTDSFDAAVSLGVLMHVPNEAQGAAIAEFGRVLRPGARLLVSDGIGPWTGENPDWLGAGVTMTWELTGIDEVAAELEAVGFEVLAREESPDELADDEIARVGLVLAELMA